MSVGTFTQTPGPRCYIPGSPGEVFKLFFTDELIDMIVRETDRYAAQVIEKEGLDKEWTTTSQEIRAYLGIMGINRDKGLLE